MSKASLLYHRSFRVVCVLVWSTGCRKTATYDTDRKVYCCLHQYYRVNARGLRHWTKMHGFSCCGHFFCCCQKFDIPFAKEYSRVARWPTFQLLTKIQNVFVHIAKCICPKSKNYLSFCKRVQPEHLADQPADCSLLSAFPTFCFLLILSFGSFHYFTCNWVAEFFLKHLWGYISAIR